MSQVQAPLGGGYPQSPDPTLSDPRWLQQLASHPIFTPRQESSGTSTAFGDQQIAGSHARLMVVRGTDLIVAVDNEVRIASLVDAKASAATPAALASRSSSFGAMSSTSYKVLVPAQGPAIDFEIQHLSLNPTGKLLACVGASQITLLVMPRSGYTKHVDRTVACRAVPIAPYYHSAHSDAAVAKVDWHPWGESGTSLLVLTDDGLLREYDVAKDTEEPQQTASFLPIQPTPNAQRSRSRSATPNLATHNRSSSPIASRSSSNFGASGGFGLSAEDDDATTAVSFALCVNEASLARSTAFDQDDDGAWAAAASRSQGPTDWSPLTVFGLMKNGDVWAICPFLPRSAVVPAAYIHDLAKLASHHANTVESEQTSSVDTQLRYVNALLKQGSQGIAKRSRSTISNGRQTSVTPGPDSFARSRSTSTMDLDQLVDPQEAHADDSQVDMDAVQDGPIRLHPPSWSYRQDVRQGGSAKRAPRPQGPFLLRPAPVELCEERETVACDIVWTWLTDECAERTDSTTVSGVGALSIVGHDGRVDVGLLFESVQGSWDSRTTRPRNAPRRKVKTPKTNRYGLSDTEDEADELEALTLDEPEELPSLLIYETIDLGLLDTAVENGVKSHAEASDLLLDTSARNRPTFVRDPLYGDTLYVYHAFGAQCLGFATWTSKLIQALNMPSQDELDNDAHADASSATAESREQALTKVLHRGENTEVVWVVNTAAPGTGKGRNMLEMNPVTAVAILSDVYLSYAFLAVTADLQLVGVELSLRVEHDGADSPPAMAQELGLSESKLPKPYVSLLGEGPAFQAPAVFAAGSGVQGLPSHPRRAAMAGASKGEVQVTPDTLRALGKTVESYRHEIREVVSAGNAVQARLDLQVREMTRQLSKLDQIRARCAALGSGDGPSVLGERVARLASTQVALVGRIDRALQRLMDSHQPSISVYERRWFDELERIAADVGITRTSSGELKPDTRARKGIAAKADRLAHQLALLRPQMDVLAGPPANERALLGADQLRKVENLLAAQATMLAEAKAKVANLNARMAQNPARQPSVAVDADLSIASIYSSPSGVPSGLPHSSTLANLASPSSFRSRTPSSFFA